MAGDDYGPEGADALSAPSGVLHALITSAGLPTRPVRRDPLHVWDMSAVERVHLADGSSVICKTAREPFTEEAEVLRYAEVHGVPVPAVLASTHTADGHLAMLLEDLGPAPDEDAPMSVGAQMAVQVHQCPPMSGLAELDAAALAGLPHRALRWLETLRLEGRWTDTVEIEDLLERLDAVSERRAQGVDIPPYRLCHSEFHPTSLHVSATGVKILDWARAFNGPGLLDLASWEDTPKPLNTEAVARMIRAYIAAGGNEHAASERGGLPAEEWAGGWHRVWICEWYLQQCVRWMPDPANDAATQRTVARHLKEAAQCLTQ
ncbi:aminoglycoside phosphotransferase family protein [Actinomadura fibrosa]|uniref:Aminoglycoside phosphotransferase family protein n=1 Tax=Actinomadura fibrosa TaxID=111802 RepID=A0ABW2XFE0_9ACTN|nr:aminoglycoside phosphotransferase family protein [Actinomadura fibrosa]